MFLTRYDKVGTEPYDSIAWLFETHLKKADTKQFNFADMLGNEDAPDEIRLWKDANPNFDQRPDVVYSFDKETGVYKVRVFEKRVIERVVKVYRVEAVSVEDASEKDDEGLAGKPIDSWSIDTEIGEDWHEI